MYKAQWLAFLCLWKCCQGYILCLCENVYKGCTFLNFFVTIHHLLVGGQQTLASPLKWSLLLNLWNFWENWFIVGKYSSASFLKEGAMKSVLHHSQSSASPFYSTNGDWLFRIVSFIVFYFAFEDRFPIVNQLSEAQTWNVHCAHIVRFFLHFVAVWLQPWYK